MPLWRRRHQPQHQSTPAHTRVHPGTGVYGPRVGGGERTPAPQQPIPAPSPDEPIGVRPRWQVERLKGTAATYCEEYRQEPYKADGSRWDAEWPRGIVEAAQWALGELEAAPISGTRTGLGVIPDVDVMEEEDDRAEWALRHPREAGYSSSYSNGVQHTMMWIVGDTDDSPIGFGDEIRL